jgi:hypothetical protein
MEKNKDLSVNINLNGKWVILLDEHVIASGDNVKELLERAISKYPNNKFVLAKIPEEGNLIY